MNPTDSAKYKSKKYFIKRSARNKRCIDVNLRGFLCSCNNREKDCIRESYNILNEYADKLYGNSSAKEESEEEEEEDISDSLTKEISKLKGEKPDRRRFQVIDSGARNLLFIHTTLENPVELAESVARDISESGKQKTMFLLRLVPVEITCRALVGDIGDAFAEIAPKHFGDGPRTFCVMFNRRNNHVVSRDDVIRTVADRAVAMGKGHKVDLKRPSLSVIVEVIRGFAFLSVVPDYLKFKRYNLLALSGRHETHE